MGFYVAADRTACDKLISLLKEASRDEFFELVPGVNAWATRNLRQHYTLMISCSFDFERSSIFEMKVSVSF